ncbi:hypothetical protein VPH35_077182 [Triticum aestivum]
MFKCRYSVRIWNLMNDWLGIQSHTTSWADFPSVERWWDTNGLLKRASRKALNSLKMLICWAIWNERNARIFQNKASLPTHIFSSIKAEAQLWVRAGVKYLRNLIPVE